ncbi:hypothetical protein [Edaphocola flava]|uniref:hypothetical protein n=1 Tax=Edaphocola flava TaxID=2499629 RepID=UPI00100B5C46|nr:hypothetical protein [Edaphocola flava]
MKNTIITLLIMALTASACQKNKGHNGHNNDTGHFVSTNFQLYDSAHRVIQDSGPDTTMHYPISRTIQIVEDTAAGKLVYMGDSFYCYNKGAIRLYSSKQAKPPFIDVTDTTVMVKLYMSWVGYRTWEYLYGTKS